MDALRRLFGGGSPKPESDDEDGAGRTTPDGASLGASASPEEVDAEERARELELLRAEQERLDDLVQRQQRYADRSWVPPTQGGPRRSDDGEDGEDGTGEDR